MYVSTSSYVSEYLHSSNITTRENIANGEQISLAKGKWRITGGAGWWMSVSRDLRSHWRNSPFRQVVSPVTCCLAFFSSHRFSCSAADALDDTRLFARQSPIYRRVFRRAISGSARCAGCRRGRITTGEIGRNKRSSSLARSANRVPSCPRVPTFPFSQRVYSTFQRAQLGKSSAVCREMHGY